MADRHIYACGGGGFSHVFNPKLHAAMVAQSGTRSPRVLSIPTASGDPKDRSALFQALCAERGYESEILTLFDTQSWQSSPAKMIEKADIIWVGGGSTFNMLVLWQAWNLVPLLRAAYDSGKPLGGVSAGAICWFEQGNTDSLGPGLGVMDCLGWIPGSCTPHYDEEELRKPTLARQLAENKIKPGIAIDNRCAVHYVNEQIAGVISETPTAGAYRVSVEGVVGID